MEGGGCVEELTVFEEAKFARKFLLEVKKRGKCCKYTFKILDFVFFAWIFLVTGSF